VKNGKRKKYSKEEEGGRGSLNWDAGKGCCYAAFSSLSLEGFSSLFSYSIHSWGQRMFPVKRGGEISLMAQVPYM